MSTDKAYEQFKLAALEVKSILIELDENIHPSVDDIEKLGEKINVLNEQIAIYKFLKGQTELSPSLNLHLKVMEKTTGKEEEEIKSAQAISQNEILAFNASQPGEIKSGSNQNVKKLELNLNDKFRMINELFNTSSTEYNLAMDQINSMPDLEKSIAYLNELKNLYRWKEDHEMVIQLYKINLKRF